MDLIDRQAAIEIINRYNNSHMVINGKPMLGAVSIIIELEDLPSAQPDPLTDKEQRIFLAAMGRERKVCKEVDDQYTHEPYEVLLTKVCDEIERKVKGALWT